MEQHHHKDSSAFRHFIAAQAWRADQTWQQYISILHLTLDLDHAQDGEEGEAEPGPGPRHVAPVPLAAGHPLPLALLPGPAPPVHTLSLQKLHLKCFLSKLWTFWEEN